MRRPFRAKGEGVAVALSQEEIELLGALPRILDSVGEVDDDPASDRLAPRAHQDDHTEAEYRQMVTEDMERGRTADREAFVATLRQGEMLDWEQAEAWLRVLGESRLVLAARVGISLDGWLPEDFPQRGEAFLVQYLGWLQESLVEALTPTLPPAAN